MCFLPLHISAGLFEQSKALARYRLRSLYPRASQLPLPFSEIFAFRALDLSILVLVHCTIIHFSAYLDLPLCRIIHVEAVL